MQKGRMENDSLQRNYLSRMSNKAATYVEIIKYRPGEFFETFPGVTLGGVISSAARRG